MTAVTPAEGAEDGSLTKLMFRIRGFTASFEDADEIAALCVAYADARDAAALAEARAEIARADHERGRLNRFISGFQNEIRRFEADAEDFRAQVAALTAQNEAMRAAVQRLLDGASGNGSRMTISKSDYDRLVDVLRAALAQSSGGEDQS